MNRLRLMRLREVPKTTSYSFKHINHYQKSYRNTYLSNQSYLMNL